MKSIAISSCYLLSTAIGALLLLATITTGSTFLFVAAASDNNPCNTEGACSLYGNGSACARGDQTKFTFALETASSSSDYVSYPICAEVDQLQAFLLNDTGSKAAVDGGDTILSGDANRSLKLYGAGAFHDVGIPPESAYGSAVIFEDTDACGSSDGAAFVNFLVLNVTLTKGEFYYRTATSEFPVQVGFQPTCNTKDECIIGDGVCIGAPGRKNCATCISSGGTMKEQTTNVWVSYYGTDVHGRRLMSGGENPINFASFAKSGALDKLRDDVSDL